MKQTLYQILNVAESASDSELRRAFKQLEQELSGLDDEESVNRLDNARVAFLTLSDRTKRTAYDQKLAQSRAVAAPSATRQQHSLLVWLQNSAVLLALVALCSLLVYWNLENKRIQQAENIQKVREMTELINAKQKSLQTELDSQMQLNSAETQADLEKRRLEGELSLQRQANDNSQSISERQLENQTRQIEFDQELKSKQAEMDLNRQKMELARENLDLEERKSNLSRQRKIQAEQRAAMTRQLALQQHDANIQSIRDLQAAKLRDYDRNHYGSGEISIFNAEQ